LVEFGHLSGLVCNVDKTTLMVIGNPILIDDRIRELGFKFVENTTILGLTINSTADLLPNFETIKTKIKNIISSWRPFMLSLPGRINIAKSMLYSQINYLGCFLSIPTNIIVELETLIVNFVKGRMNIAKKRLFRAIEDGGLGLFDLENFLGTQQCTWIKRSISLNEQWKVLLYSFNYGRIYNAKANNICKEEYPVLENICRNYEKFQNVFTKHNENFKRSYIIENTNVTRALENRELIRRNIFGNAFLHQNVHNFLGLRYCDFYKDDGTMVQARDVIAATGIQFTAMQLLTIRSACSVLKERCSKQEIAEKKHCSIDEFLIRHKKGSGHIRKILSAYAEIGIPHNVNKYSDNMDIVISVAQSKFLNKLWSLNIFTNAEKTFFFKLHNNTLGYNTVVAHFVRGHSPTCTFCDLLRTEEEFLETPLHLFYNCTASSNIIDSVLGRTMGDDQFLFSQREFLATFDRKDFSYAKNFVLTVISKLTIKYIWDCRNRKTLPTLENCFETLSEKINTIKQTSNKFNRLWDVSGLNNIL
jgi:hypothetical protein